VVLEDKVKIQIKDDVPVLKDHEICLTVDEDDIDTNLSQGTSPNDGNGDGSYTGNPANDDPGPAFVSGSLAGVVVESGADEPLTFSFIGQGNLGEHLVEELAVLAGLSSQGESLRYDIQGNVLYGFVGDGGFQPNSGDRLVFQFTLQPNGDFTFELFDQLDHDPPNDDWLPLDLADGVPLPFGGPDAEENYDLEDNVPFFDVAALPFGYLIKATDHDGDSVIIGDNLVIKIRDDVPEATGVSASIQVDEDELSTAANDLTDGITDNPPDTVTDEATFTKAALQALFTGADEPIKFSLNLSISGIVQTTAGVDVTSQGALVRFDRHGNDIVGFVNLGGGGGAGNFNAGIDREVFRIIENGDGSFTFDLKDKLDHLPLDEGDGDLETLILDLTKAFRATDFDGDEATLPADSIQVVVENDVPVVFSNTTNYVFNGDFSQGSWTSPTWWGSSAPQNGVTGWSLIGTGTTNFERPPAGYLGLTPSTGAFMLDMAGSPGNHTVSQSIGAQPGSPTLTNGTQYVLELEVGAPFPGTALLEVYWNNQFIGTIDTTVFNGTMDKYAFIVTGTGNPATDVITFKEVGTNTSNPVPGTWPDQNNVQQPLATEGHHGTYIANVKMYALDGVVDEDGLTGPLSFGNDDSQIGDALDTNADGDTNEATTTGTLNITWGADNFNGGADGFSAAGGFTQDGGGRNVTFANNLVEVFGTNALTSNGDTISFELQNGGTKLVAIADDDGPNERVVFEVTLSDDGSGAFHFVLKDQLDHAEGAHENDIALKFNFIATDSDGDTAIGSFTVGIDDDVPVIAGEIDCLEVKEDGQIEPGKDANFVLVLDSSGSVDDGQLALIKANAIDFLNDVAASGAENVRIHIVDFDSNSRVVGTFDIVVNGEAQDAPGDAKGDQLQAAIDAINGLSGGGNTNYEAALAQAKEWVVGNTVTVTNAHEFDADTVSQGGGTDSDNDNRAYVLTDANGVRIAVVSAWEPFGTNVLTDADGDVSGGFGVTGDDHLNEIDEMLRFDFGAFDNFGGGSLGDFNLADEAAGFRGSEISAATFSLRSFGSGDHTVLYKVFYTDGSNSGPTLLEFDFNGSNLLNQTINAEPGKLIAYIEFTVPVTGGTGRVDLESVTVGNGPIPSADVNQVIFFSDGEPNRQLENDGDVDDTGTQNAVDEAQDEIEAIENAGFTIEAFGANVTGSLTATIDASDGDNDANLGAGDDDVVILSDNGVAIALVSAWSNSTIDVANLVDANDSSDGIGSDGFPDENLNGTEVLRFDFGPGSDYDNAGNFTTLGFNGPNVTSATFTFDDNNGGGDTVFAWTIHFVGGGTQTGSRTVTNDENETLTGTGANAGKFIDYIEFNVTSGQGRIDLQSVGLGEPIGQHILDQIDSNDAQNITDDEGLGDAYAPLIASLGGGGSGGGSASASAELSTIVASGADENVTFSFKTDVTPLLNQNLKSGGIALFYTVAVNPNGDDIIAATKGQGGPVVFTLTLEQDGTATFNLVGNLDHGGEDFLEIEFDGMIVAVDHDGDPVAVPLCVEVENGEEPPPPQITLDGDIVHDESDGLQNPDPALNATSTEDDNDDDVLGSDTVSGTTTIEDLFASLNDGEIGQDPDFTPAELDNSDPNQPAIGYAREKFVFVANPAEPGVTRAFSLDIPDGPNVDSGLATTEGKAIFLFVEDGLVVGRVSDNPAEANAQGDIAFAIAVDPNTGELFVAQYLSIHHDVVATGLAHDDLENLIAGSVQIVVTDTNSAGSTSSNTNIGHLIKFEDDGPKVEVCEPTGNDFPTWPQDISHIVLYFQQEAGDDAPGANGDGFYLVKIDNVPSLAPDDLDAWIEQALDWLIANDPHIDENSDLLGAVIKGGNEATQFYAYGNHNANGADPDTIPTGAPGITPPPPQGDVDGTNIDQTYEFSVVFPNGAPTESSSGDDCTLTLKLDESVVDPPPPDAPAETGTIAPGDDDIGQAGPNGLTPFGRTTADVSGLFTVDAGSDGEQSKLYTLLMKTLPGGDPSGQVSVVTDILATDLFATQPAPGGNPGAPFGDPRIYLLQAGPYTINGYVGAPNAGEPSGPLALRITIDPSTGVVTLEQYLAIHHTDANDHDFPVTEQSALLEGVLAKLTVTDGDGDVASAEVPVSITIEDDGPSIEHANVFYDDDLTVDESVGADPLDSNANDETTDLPSALDSYATAHNLTVIGAAVRLATPNHTVEFGSDGGTISRVFSLGIGQNSDPITNGTPTDLNMVGTEFPIFLFNEGGLLVGKAGPNVAAAAANGTIMFAIHIDPTTGTVSMAQYRAVEHDSSDHDESDSPAFFELDVKMVVTATDGDGDTDAATASGVSIRFNFEDDGPDVEIVGTSNSVDEGQVVSGNWTLDQGSDGVPSVVVSIDGTGISEPFTFASGEQAIINFPLGTLIVRADGTWQFTANPVAGDQQFTFTIRAADSDGDSDSDSHTITINDVSQPPVITSAADASLDEDGFTGAPYFANVDGSGPNDANETNNLENLTHAGQIQVSFGSDQPGNLLAAFAFQTTGLDGQLQTTDGTAVEFAVESGELVGRRADNDDEVIRIEISGVVDNGGGNIQYNYLATLSQPIKHSGNPTEDSDVLADVPFSVTNSSGPATGSFDVTIWDDVPVARSDSAQVSEGGQSALNLALVVDISESMEENPGVPGFATRIELARAALIEMLENATVNRVAIVRFRGIAIDSDGSNADPDGGDGNLTWMTKAQAIAYLQNAANFDADVISDGGTDYDAPISFVQNEWVAPPAGGDQTLLYFLSDGVPSEGDNTTGIDVGEAATWETFLTTNNVAKAIAVGIGSGVTTTALDPIAYPNGDSSNPVVLTDEGDLIDTLSGTIPGTVSGNVLLGNNGIDDAGSPGGDDDGLGADGGRILSIKVGTVTYTYDPITGDITASTGPNPTANTPALTVTTPAGGTLTFYFAAVPGHAAGDWTYVSPSGLSADVVEPFLYHLVDGDGDTTYATLSITVLNQNVAPVVSGLVVTESGISFNIADPDSSSFTLNPTGANAFGNLTLGLGANFLPATEQPNFTAVTGLLQIDDGTGGIANVVRIHLGTSLSTTFSAGGTTPAAMYGFGGSDNLTGGSAGDWIFGGVGTDTLTGGGGADTLVGGANDDTFSLANGDFVAGESIDGGSGNDTIALTTTGDGQSIDLTVGTISNVENLVSVDQGSGNGYDQTFTLTAAQWAGLSTIDTNDGTDTLNVNVSGNVDVSSLGTTTLTSVENRNITGTGGADSITLTGAQLNEFIGGSNTSINLGGGSDTINLTSTSTDLNGLSNAALTGVETISAASAVANVKINVSNQTEAFTIIGGSGADTLVGGSGSDTLTGNGGVDQFRLRTNGGLDTITDYTDNVDKIAFFDNGSTGSGSVNFGGTAGNAAGAALAAGDFQIRTSISNINSADDRHVILINAAQTTAQITSNTGGSSSENSYVIVFNSTTGRGEIWFDTDWDSTGSRVQIATLDNITSLAQLTAITASDIVVYNSVTDPLILDLGAPGLDFTGVVDGVSFDINADGLPDQMAWTVGEDGILALDVDGNGTIDNGSEIFSPQFAGGEHAGSLAALATLDENGDGRIDAGDSAYQNLKVWQDLDHDGVSDAGELTGLAALGITGINLGATAVDGYVNGQQLLAEGTFTYADGSTGSFAEVGFETELGEGETYVVGADQPPLTIEGFVQGDSLDLSALLDANFQDGDTVGDFIRLEQSGADIKVQVDTNGPSGGANFVDVAVLAGYGTSNADIVRVVFENQTQQLSA
jgi:T1SS-143 domain-containing protein